MWSPQCSINPDQKHSQTLGEKGHEVISDLKDAALKSVFMNYMFLGQEIKVNFEFVGV